MVISAKSKYANTKPANPIRRLCFVASMIVLFASTCIAQLRSTDGQTPLGLAPGAPAGSYSLSDLDQVNLFNGNLDFGIPIGHIGGRGSAGYTMMVRVLSPKWGV